MVLKVQLDGAKKTLTSPGRAPITFINGQKKRLIKGITFINGQKKRLIKGITFINGQKVVLWNSQNMSIEYISGVYELLGYVPTAACASRQQVILTGNKKIISRLNIANASNPYLEASVANGMMTSYSKIDSASDTQMIFYGCAQLTNNPGSQYGPAQQDFSYVKIGINPSNLAIQVIESIGYSGTVFPAPVKIGSAWWAISSSTSASVSINGVASYSFSQYAANQINKIDSNMIKLDNGQCVGALFSTTIGHGIGIYTSSGVSALVSGKEYSSLLVGSNGNYLVAGPSGIGLYNAQGGALATINATPGYNYSVIGQIGSYYYLVEEPAPSNSPVPNVTLIILNLDGSIRERRALNLSVQAAGVANPDTYGSHVNVIPSISKTGFLAFYWMSKGAAYPVAQDRLVKIEGY